MGFFSKLFSVTSCRNCGGTDLHCVHQLYGSNCKLMACRKCNKVYVYGQAPLCAHCGKPMRGTAYHSGGAVVPKCTSCGHIFDCDERGWVNID